MQRVMSRFEREGLRQGLLEGRQEGQREERLALVALLLERRVGALGGATEARLWALDNDQLLALYPAALDFAGRDDLARWLAAAPARPQAAADGW